ncbi:MAG: DVUA0089 family protein [Deltaproteobacteria bacterium]|nr:DVUA0089 family protein [Deltaproteobacteria bacterium]
MRTLLRSFPILLAGFLVACGDDTPTPKTQAKPSIRAFTASAGSVARGGKVTLSFDVLNAASVHIVADPGGDLNVPEGELVGVVESQPLEATTTFTLTAEGGGSTATKQLMVSVDAPAQPVIVKFESDRGTATAGERVSLSFEATNASSISIVAAPGGPITVPLGIFQGSVFSNPLAETTEFTLTATGPGGSASSSVTVTVVTTPGPAEILSFLVTPSAISSGQTATLSWETRNATSVRISASNVDIVPAGTRLVDSEPVSPTLTTTYVLEAIGPTGPVTAQAVLSVTTPAAPAIVSFTASPTLLSLGQSTTLSWTVTNAASVEIRVGAQVLSSSSSLTGTFVHTPPLGSTTYVLRATNPDGQTEQPLAISVVEPAPVIQAFTAAPTSISVGGQATLSWQVTGAVSLALRAGTSIIHSEPATTGVGQLAVSPSVTTTYSLEATNPSGTVSRTLSVGVVVDPSIVSFTVTPNYFFAATEAVTLDWETADATSTTLSANGVPVAGFPGTPTGSFVFTVSSSTTFALTALGSGTPVEQTDTVHRLSSETEPNDTRALAGPIDPFASVGALDPMGDLDWYWFDVPADANVFIQTYDLSAGCTVDTVVSLYAPDGQTILTANDDVDAASGQYCSQISARTDPRAQSLPAGRYYVLVQGYNDGQGGIATGDYLLQVTLVPAGCGNAIRELAIGETCDDGNGDAGDGCGACQVEISDSVVGPTLDRTFSGSLAQYASRYIELTLTSTAYVRARVGVPTVDECLAPDNDTVLLIQDSTHAGVLLNDDIDTAAGNTCSAIAGSELPPGTYYVWLGTYTPLPAYELRVEVFGPACGNGVLDVGEACDDGNTTAGDGCSAACLGEPVAVVNPPGLDTNVDIRTQTDVQFLQLNVTSAGQSVSVTIGDGLSSCPPFPSLVLYDASWIELGRFDTFQLQTGEIVCGRLDPVVTGFSADLAPGVYFVAIANIYNQPPAVLAVSVRITNATCGDSVLASRVGESCDDGNAAAGDGCSAACQFEAGLVPEVEPNGSSAFATPSTVAAHYSFGGSLSAGDHDWYAFEIPAGPNARIDARTHSLFDDLTSCSVRTDTFIEIVDSSGTVLAANDDVDAQNQLYCSAIESDPATANLAPGPYFLHVRGYNELTVVPVYYLEVDIR